MCIVNNERRIEITAEKLVVFHRNQAAIGPANVIGRIVNVQRLFPRWKTGENFAADISIGENV